jgi:hypothetical protein
MQEMAVLHQASATANSEKDRRYVMLRSDSEVFCASAFCKHAKLRVAWECSSLASPWSRRCQNITWMPLFVRRRLDAVAIYSQLTFCLAGTAVASTEKISSCKLVDSIVAASHNYILHNSSCKDKQSG